MHHGRGVEGTRHPPAPRKSTNDQFVEQVKQWIAEGFQVLRPQESCGFGFVLHRRLVAAGAQRFLITPVALNDARKSDPLDARSMCLRLSRRLDGNRAELAPIRIPSEAEPAPPRVDAKDLRSPTRQWRSNRRRPDFVRPT